MPRSLIAGVAVLVLSGLTIGCAARFSPGVVRNEIVRQRAQDPLGVFELDLGRFTTALLKTALSDERGQRPFEGLRELQLSVYETAEAGGPAIDVTRMGVRGWEPVIRFLDDRRSAMILVRGGGTGGAPGGTIGDLVVVGAGRSKVVYARLRGRLASELPQKLGELFREGGPDEVRRVLTELAE